MTNQQFIDKVAPMAQAGWTKYKILPSVTIAQAILESGWGKSGLTINANALFGIKAGSSWKGKVYSCKTQECYDGVNYTTITDVFRAYDSWEESVEDHGAFLAGLSRYKNLIGVTDYVKVCDLLKADGYATAPTYSTSLQNLIKSYNLTQYDRVTVPTGWQKSGSKWYYYENGQKVKSAWREITGKSGTFRYYLGADGAMLTGTQKIGGKVYHLHEKAACGLPEGALVITDGNGIVQV